jgi:arginine/ornithine transport system substrate-binding protein
MRLNVSWHLAVLFCLLGLPAVLRAETLRIGMDLNYPPFSWQDSHGTPQGFDADMARALCLEMKVDCRIVPQDWDGLTRALYLHKFDAILSSMQITRARMKTLDFTQKYYKVASRLVVPLGAPVDRAAFSRKRIGVLRGSTQASFARDFWGKAGAHIVDYAKIGQAFDDLAAHRLDAVFVDEVVGSSSFLRTPAARSFAFSGPAYDDPRYFGLGAGIAVRKGDARLRERLDRALAHLIQDGRYQKIQSKYFSFDIYGK